MPLNPPKVLFTIKDRLTGNLHPVEYWRNYGVVCPTLLTSNGKYRYLVHCIMNQPHVTQDKHYEVLPGEIAPANLDEWELLNGIRSWLEAERIKEGRTLETLPVLPASNWS